MFCRLLLVGLLSALTLNAAALPAYLEEALTRFAPEIPKDYAYTLTTQRGSDISVERFDPSQPIEQQWTLLERNHRPATTEENARYSSYRITVAPNARATFKRGDIDLNSFRLISETATHAEYQARFREDLVDPMLHHLELVLTVAKHPPGIERFVLQLTEPFSPIISVKMQELKVETVLSPPADHGPTLPKRTTSRFRGRLLLFKSIEEDVQTVYTGFVQVTPLPVQPPATPP
jgi:hypothetical protein